MPPRSRRIEVGACSRRSSLLVGPFIFFDHFGPAYFERGISRNVDVRPHPHIELSTVTYLFDGEIMHRDSVASEQAIRPGEVNWMLRAAALRIRSASGLDHDFFNERHSPP